MEPTRAGWESFEHRLRLTLERMTPQQFFVISAHHPALDGSLQVLPYAQVLREAHRFTAELSGNRFLGPDCQLEVDQEAELTASGWELDPDAQGNWSLHALTDDETAARMVAAIRDVFRVVHPSLLTVDNVGSFAEGDPGPSVAALVGSDDPADHSVSADPLPRTLSAVIVDTPDQLIWLLEDFLGQHLGIEVHADADGAIALKMDDVLVLVQPATGGMPWVHCSALVAQGLDASLDLHRYLNAETGGLSAVQLSVADGAVFARCDVLGSPFMGPTIAVAVDSVVQAAQAMRAPLQEQFGGANIYPDSGLGGYL